MIKVMIADDQALIRESLQIILSVYADIDVVSVVGDGIEAMDNIMTVKPDIILMDIRMPRMDGVLATKEIKKLFPNIKIIILTTFDDDEFIQTVYKGGAMINPNIASKVFQLFSQMAQTNFSITVKEENIENISLTEWKIIQQVAFGESNKEIASNLFLSEGTVRNYLSIILSKLNLRDRTQLAIWAVQTGVTQKNFSKEMDK